ncbi:phenylalanine--tRNA ligase subunit beta [Candidatus Saccharibacteria bacterium oral taxon 488]|nr:phenylalanine--tRNA ligase subunit beta [Candidatus Saccharibacteria bacterium oral taxon 488]QLF51946.1 phenylalanine--tRNA ligase subunit beta [Candidatus Saccharibacteria bacterium oral taxon 488]
MKVSLNIIKQLINFELPPVDELVARVNQQLGGVEEVIDLKAKYDGARVVRVVECAKHPDADRLSVTKIDDGGAVADVPRDENGLVQVVCGAPNVHADMWAIWLPPKSTVPASFDDDEPFVLDARPLRGVLSQGMLAAADELDIGTDHEGIVEIHERDVPAGVELTAGAGFAETFGLDDYVLDIENKMFTHRPDCFGQLGVAREIVGIFHQQFTSPEWYNVIQEFAGGDGLELEIFNEATEVVPVFSAVAIKNIEVRPSPLWLQCQLVAMGGKPINNIVDATNYMMLMTAQPTHAYDYDRLRGSKLGARLARDGEKVSLLNGKEYELTTDDIVIADGEGVIGLAGIMGGTDTEVSDGTKNIVLECANFDMYALRRTAMRHGIFTDALTRFNKGQSPAQADPVLKRLMGMTGGEQASPVLFKNHQSLRSVLAGGTHWCGGLLVPSGFVEERLGVNFADGEMNTLLGNVEFFVDEGREYGEDGMMVYSPFWRTDIELPEDIVEEVGRLYGFDKLPRQLPHRSIKPAPKNLRRELKNAVRRSLSRAGANEVLTYSFVHECILKNAEQDVAQAYKLSNALSPDLQYYRLTVLPSLLDKVHANIKAGHDEFALFEMGKGHSKMHGLGEDGLPEASQFTDIVYAAKKPGAGAPFYKIRRLVEQLARDLGAELVFKPIEQELTLPVAAPFDRSRSALIETTDGTFIGLVGELKQSVIKNFKLPTYVAAASLDTAGLEAVYAKRDSHYRPLSRYPSTTRDISLKVPSAVRYQQLLQTLDEAIRTTDMNVRIEPLTIYQSEHDAAQKTMTWRLTFTSHERTLTDKDIAPVMQQIEQAAKDAWGAEVV